MTSIGHRGFFDFGKEQGFTLIELVLALVVLAIVAAIAAPSFIRQGQNTNLRAAARDIISDCYNLKERAIAESIYYRITLNTGSNNYAVRKGTSVASPGDGVAPFMIKTPASFGDDVHISSMTFSGGNIYFQPRGTTNMGTIILKNGRNSTATIVMNITGRPRVQFDMQ
jgi:type IV fimbrial biogenesis protein FimT